MRNRLTTALVLSGGGARAAYQVGVLRALARMQAECTPATVPALRAQEAPFGIVVGTSAGAINSAAVACRADAFGDAVADLAQVWGNFHADQVYEADAWGVIRSGAHWITALSAGWAFARWRKLKPRSLLDNSPLASLLRELVPMERLPTMFARKHLGALAVTASSYSNGQHMTFYSSATPIEPWVRPQRQAVPGFLSHDHLLASSAIPFIFPARRLTHAGATTWFGDGSMRQTAPLSPAMHLGADRLLVVGAGRAQEAPAEQLPERRYPSMAQIAGHAMASVFLDTLAVDIERLERVNRVLSLMSPAARAETPWKTVRCLVVSPSQRIDDIAARHLEALPRPVRALLGGIGVARQGARTQGAALASYLLFEAPFTQELMALGEADAQARRQEILDFMDWSVVRDADHCAVPPGSCA